MSLFAIGDIHGCFTALETLVVTVPLTPRDLIVTLGDYVDRGPNSRQVVEWLIEKTYRAECIPLRGNHEVMMLGAMSGRFPMSHWLQFGGDQALQSYSADGRSGRPEEIPVEHLRFLDTNLLPYFESENHLFAHACLRPDVSLDQQDDETLYWTRFDEIQPHPSEKTIICGHTAQKSGVPLNLGYAVCIDTWAYGRGWLTCLQVDSGQYWQANQYGETRTGWLQQDAHTDPADES
jgi:serine/threonine protein phosphatase 1